MAVAVSTECPVCAGAIDIPDDVMMGELLDCDDCSAELEVTRIQPGVELAEAPMAAEDWGE